MIADMQFQPISKDQTLVFFPRIAFAYLAEKNGFNPCTMPTWKAAISYISANKILPVAELVDTETGVGWQICGKGLSLDMKLQTKIKAKCMKFTSLTFDPEKIEKDRAHLIMLNAYVGSDLVRKMVDQGDEIYQNIKTEQVEKLFRGISQLKPIQLPELPTTIDIEAEELLEDENKELVVHFKTMKNLNFILDRFQDLSKLCFNPIDLTALSLEELRKIAKENNINEALGKNLAQTRKLLEAKLA